MDLSDLINRRTELTTLVDTLMMKVAQTEQAAKEAKLDYNNTLEALNSVNGEIAKELGIETPKHDFKPATVMELLHMEPPPPPPTAPKSPIKPDNIKFDDEEEKLEDFDEDWDHGDWDHGADELEEVMTFKDFYIAAEEILSTDEASRAKRARIRAKNLKHLQDERGGGRRNG